MNFYSDNRLPRLSTDLDSAIQHLHYLPFGEEQIDQRLTNFNSRYTFSAKEKDIETGYSYFGARYYTSDLSIWLSVDPLSDKYPNMSPYNYCANNPVILVDPNGEDIELTFYRGSNGENSQNEFTKTVNGGLGGQFEAYYSKGKNGGYLLNLKATKGGGDVSKMSPESKAFYNELKGMIDDHNTTSEVNVKCGSSKVVIGDFTKSTIDIGDINQFDNMRKGAATKQ
jgi:RHS repeat-associated protein